MTQNLGIPEYENDRKNLGIPEFLEAMEHIMKVSTSIYAVITARYTPDNKRKYFPHSYMQCGQSQRNSLNELEVGRPTS